MEIIVKTQAELDAALAATYTDFTYIYIQGGTIFSRLQVGPKPKNAVVVARESSHVEAWGSSHVEAWESSHVVARESSHVEAWESSHVEAWGSSHVEAWESSHVVARGSSALHVHSTDVTADLFGFAVALLISKATKVLKKSKTATIVRPLTKAGVAGWLEGQAIKAEKGTVILYKRASKDWQTQEGTANATTWTPGTTVEHPAWNPTDSECGAGKFHACSRAYFCDEFRDKRDDRYVAIRIATKDLYAWPQASYPHKVAFRKGTVLHECDRYGKEVKAAAVAA